MRYEPASIVTLHKPAAWICDGLLHRHRSERAALKCEDNPNARTSGARGKGWTRDDLDRRATPSESTEGQHEA